MRNKDGSTPLRHLRQQLQQAAAAFVVRQLEVGKPLSPEVGAEWEALRCAVFEVADRENEVYGKDGG